jgi:hypothetical protein
MLQELCVNENCSKFQTAKCLRGVYSVKFGLKKEDALSLFHVSRAAVFYAFLEVKANKK